MTYSHLKLVTLLFLLVCPFISYTQTGIKLKSNQNNFERCNTDQALQTKLNNDDAYRRYYRDVRKPSASAFRIGCDNVNSIIIPVAFHFDASFDCVNTACILNEVQDQLEVLNQAFQSNENSPEELNCPAAYTDENGNSVASTGTCIQFCLAVPPEGTLANTDPICDPAITIGIYDGGFSAGGFGAPGWVDILNIFITSDNCFGVADGIPGQANGDGVTVCAQAFGGLGPASPDCNLDTNETANEGAVLVHEIGHYLGLYHTFEGGCEGEPISPGGLRVSDTPAQFEEFRGCPSSCVNSGCLNEVTATANYMNYTDDSCMSMFTEDQAAIMNYVAFSLFGDAISQCSEEQMPSILTSVCEQDFCVKICASEVLNQISGSDKYCQSNDAAPFPDPFNFGLEVDEISDLAFTWSIGGYLNNGGQAVTDSLTLATSPCSITTTDYYLNINCGTTPFTPSLEGGVFQTIVYPGPPDNFEDVITFVGENSCDLPEIRIIDGCEEYFIIKPSDNNPVSPIAPGYSGEATYNIEFTPHPESPNCCLIQTAEDGDIITNGDFENFGIGWTEREEVPPGTINPNPFGIICVSQGFLNGSCDAWLGGWGQPSLLSLQQDIIIPEACDSLFISFDYGSVNCAEGSDLLVDVLINDIVIANVNCSFPMTGTIGPINISTLDIPIGPASFVISALETGFTGQSIFVDNISLIAKECFIEKKCSESIKIPYACTEAKCSPEPPLVCSSLDIDELEGSSNAVIEINNSNLTIGNAILTIAQEFKGSSQQDENVINNSQTSGDIGIRLGVSNATNLSNSMKTTYQYSQAVCDHTIQIWDVDESDALILTGYLDGLPVSYTVSELGTCLNQANNQFYPINESCEIQADSESGHAFTLTFEDCIDEFVIEFFDQGGNNGGSYTTVFGNGCTSPCKGPDLNQLVGSNSAIEDINEASLTVGDAVMTIDNIFNGSSSNDENDINSSQTNGDIGIRLGSINSVGILNSMETQYNFSLPICDFNISIWDIDETDEILIEAFYQGEPIPFSIVQIGSCITSDGQTFFPDGQLCQQQLNGAHSHSFILQFDGCIDELVTKFYDQGGDTGGSFTIVPGVACPKPSIAPNSGTLKAINSNQCLAVDFNLLSAEHLVQPVIPNNYEAAYILTNGDDLIIQDFNTEPSFTVTEIGSYTIHSLIAELSNPEESAFIDLNALQIGVSNIFELYNQTFQGGGQICASILITGAEFRISEIDIGELVALQDNFCFTEGQSFEIGAAYNIPPSYPIDYEIVYLLASGEDNVIEQISDDPSFVVDTTRAYTIHSFIGEFSSSENEDFFNLASINIGETSINDISLNLQELSICGLLDEVGVDIQFNSPKAVALSPDVGDTCFDNQAYIFTASPVSEQSIPDGYEQVYVIVTVPDFVIYEQSSTPSFSINTPGEFAIFNIVAELSDNSDPNYIDLDNVNNLNDLYDQLTQGGGGICGDIGIPGASFSLLNPVSGSITSETTDLCLTNGIAFVNFSSNLDYVIPNGYVLGYFLTDIAGNILSYSTTALFQVFNSGMYNVHPIVSNIDNTLSPGYLDILYLLSLQTSIQDICLMLSTCDGSICADIDPVGISFLIKEDCCESDIVVNDVPIQTNNYSSTTSITSSGLINQGPVEFSTGECIDLVAGFEVIAGAVFNAVMEGCK